MEIYSISESSACRLTISALMTANPRREALSIPAECDGQSLYSLHGHHHTRKLVCFSASFLGRIVLIPFVVVV